jgi:hypothetical protein
MKARRGMKANLAITTTAEEEADFSLTNEGTFKMEDLEINADGMKKGTHRRHKSGGHAAQM